MADKRRTSPSDELLEQARAAGGDPTAPGSFEPRSPTDAYLGRTGGDVSADDRGGEADRGDLDAATIAEQLLAAGQIATPTADVASSDRNSEPMSHAGASTLPSWATGPPRPGPPKSAVSGPDVSQRPADVASLREPEAGMAREAEDVGEDRWSTPTTEWEQREAARRAKEQRRFDIPVPRLRSLISLAVFGFFALGFIVSLVDGREPIANAAVGECFVVGDADEIDEVPVVDCTEPHDSELFARVDVSTLGTAYPGEDTMFEWLFDECVARFPDYVGESYEASRYWIDMFIPTTDAWDDGDHTGLCTLVVLDDDLEVVSVTGTGRAPTANA
jgi:hypothetical protein